MNSLLLYLGHGLTKDTFPFSYTLINPVDHTGYFFQNVFGTAIWLAIAYRLYKKEIFISV